VRQFRGYGLSLAETAAALGVSQPYLSQAVKKWTIPN
jgi:transcriptional regulator with XRE-family HTH domain